MDSAIAALIVWVAVVGFVLSVGRKGPPPPPAPSPNRSRCYTTIKD